MITNVIKVCRLCKSEHELDIKETDMERFRKGVPVQMCFPYLKAEERELFISGICGKCWDELFHSEDGET